MNLIYFSFSISAKSLAIKCVVDSVWPMHAVFDSKSIWKRRTEQDYDGVVFIPSTTPFCEIFETALQILGYTMEVAGTARGVIIVKNWQPLTVEQISENPMKTIADVLGDIYQFITVRILILRAKLSPLADVRDKLFKCLLIQSQSLLRSTGCPLDEVNIIVSLFITKKYEFHW